MWTVCRPYVDTMLCLLLVSFYPPSAFLQYSFTSCTTFLSKNVFFSEQIPNTTKATPLKTQYLYITL